MSKMTACRPTQQPPLGKKWIFRPWVTKPNGKRLYAKQLGLRAFPILVDAEE